MTTSRKVQAWLTLSLLVIPWAHAQSAPHVWSEHPIAAIQVGQTGTNEALYRVATIGLVAPDTTYHKNFKRCGEQALAAAGTQLRQALNDAPSFDSIVTDLASAGASTSAESLKSQQSSRSANVTTLFEKASENLKSAISTCIGPGPAVELNKNVVLAINFRECPFDTDVCRWSKSSKVGPRNQPRVFERIFSWASATQPRKQNTWMRLSDKSITEFATNDVSEVTTWPNAKDPKQAIEELERLVLLARKSSKVRLSYAVPAAVGVKRETALRFIDELDAPFTAMTLLAAGSDQLASISDELGRSRLRDCSLLQGKFSAEAIGECAGFRISEVEIYDCLTGKRCLPTLNDQALRLMMRIDRPLDLQGLVNATQLPRVGVDIPYPKWVEVAQACSAEPDAQKRNDCLLRGTMAPEDFAMVDCVQKAGVGNAAKLMDCATGLATGTGKAIVNCLEENSANPGAAVYCAVKQNMDAHLVAAVDCYKTSGSSQGEFLTCIGKETLGGREGRLLDCYQKHSASVGAAMMCAAAGEIKGADDLVSCANQHPGSWQDMAVCVGASQLKLDGDVGRIVACGLSSGGSVIGTAACAAGSSLRPEQAIVLQCAATASTGPGFFVCTGGLLAFNEFNQCKGRRVGTGNCFGPNNEIRRFVRALGLPDIGQNSIAAHVLQANVDVIEGAVRFGEVALKGLGQLAENIGKVAEGAFKAVAGLVGGVVHLGDKVAERAAKIFGW